jgi:LysR family hydrogen peroxide-inducible transcriptional activator
MLLNSLSLRDLEYAVAVAEEKHFGRAARRCNVSQPGLSAQVKKLEATLGARLFERTPRGVLMTEAGATLIRQARRTLEEGRRFMELAAAGEALSGALRLDAIATLGPYLAPYILRPLRERFPKTDFVLREGRTEQIVAALLAGETDLALVSTPIHAEGVAILPLFEEPFVAIHPKEMALPARKLTIDDLDGTHLLLLEEGHCLRDQALALCGRDAANAQRHATSLATLRHLVAAGAGYSLLPALAATDRESFGGLLHYRAIDDDRAFRTIALAHRSSDPRMSRYHQIADTIRESLPKCVRRIEPRERRRRGGGTA